ncbi:hypothetical protein AB2I57_25360 (plasmid) [Escherichia coli]
MAIAPDIAFVEPESAALLDILTQRQEDGMTLKASQKNQRPKWIAICH